MATASFKFMCDSNEASYNKATDFACDIDSTHTIFHILLWIHREIKYSRWLITRPVAFTLNFASVGLRVI